jgi:hypothetical protein
VNGARLNRDRAEVTIVNKTRFERGGENARRSASNGPSGAQEEKFDVDRLLRKLEEVSWLMYFKMRRCHG